MVDVHYHLSTCFAPAFVATGFKEMQGVDPLGLNGRWRRFILNNMICCTFKCTNFICFFWESLVFGKIIGFNLCVQRLKEHLILESWSNDVFNCWHYLQVFFVFGKNRSGFIIPKEATPANNMAPATSNHHGWWQREGIASLGGEKSPLQNTSLVHQMWMNTKIKGCLLNSSLTPMCHSPVNAFTSSSMTSKSNIHALIGENFPT